MITPNSVSIFPMHAGFRGHDPQRITVDSLKEETGVTDHQLNQRCTLKHLRDITPYVGNYHKFVTHFNLRPGDLADIKVDPNLSHNLKTEAVFLWWHRNIQNATYLSFVQVCLDPTVSEGDVARKMCKLCQQVRLVNLLRVCCTRFFTSYCSFLSINACINHPACVCMNDVHSTTL